MRHQRRALGDRQHEDEVEEQLQRSHPRLLPQRCAEPRPLRSAWFFGALLGHEAFTLKNPNRARSLIGAFAGGNPTGFHRADGAGYALVAGQLLLLDRLNPQVAARMMTPFGRWRRYDAARQELMRAQLERILAAPSLSRDSFEIASKSLQ